MKNKIRNDIIRKRAIKGKKKLWWKRIGNCNPKKCGGACCRYSVTVESSKREYQDFITGIDHKNIFGIKRVGRKDLIIKNAICPNMTMDCKCKLHNKGGQPYTCDVFPMHPRDGVYLAVKKFCSYKFVKVII